MIVFYEPHPIIDGASCKVSISAEDAIKHQRASYRYYDINDIEDSKVLLDFLIIHHAWVLPETETYNWNDL